MYRWLVPLLIALPFASAYTISDYTGGDVNIDGVFKLTLPVETGENCIPILYLVVEGNETSPKVTVNGKTVKGEGSYRFLLEGNTFTLEASGSGIISGKSRVECSKDPFIDVVQYAPVPVKIGNYNYYVISIYNSGYSGTTASLYIKFPDVVASWEPVKRGINIPPRSVVNYSMFLVSGPFFEGKFAFPRVCVRYSDSFSEVVRCSDPVASYSVLKPLVKCIDGVCYNVSTTFIGNTPPGGVIDSPPSYAEVITVPLRKINTAPEDTYLFTLSMIISVFVLLFYRFVGKG